MYYRHLSEVRLSGHREDPMEPCIMTSSCMHMFPVKDTTREHHLVGLAMGLCMPWQGPSWSRSMPFQLRPCVKVI